MKNKLFNLINKKMPEKDLFSKIENETKVVAATTPLKKKSRKPLIISLSSLSAVLLVGGISLSVAMSGRGLKGEANGTIGVVPGAPEWVDKPMGGMSGGTSGDIYYPGGVDEEEFSKGDGDYKEEPGIEGAPSGDKDISNNQGQYFKKLTASEVSDFEAFKDYVNLINGDFFNEDQSRNDDFKKIYDKIHTQDTIISTKNLFAINFVDSNDTPINNVYTELVVDENKVFTSYSNMFGNSYLYATNDLKENSNIKINYKYGEVTSSYTIANFDVENYYSVKLNVEAHNTNKVDLVFLIDTTGSMGDEMDYITNELLNITSRIVEDNFDLQIGFVLYKDLDDAQSSYVTKYYDLSSSYNEARTYISKELAKGGGDFPEAIEEGLKVLNNDISWRKDSTRLAFHIFDAPSHEERGQKVYNEYLSSASKGIRLVPVTCSGMDIRGELMAREEALFTGGRYTYLTSHSGIGGSHLEATTSQEVVVEYFEDLIVRITKEYGLGEKLEKVPYDKVNVDSSK